MAKLITYIEGEKLGDNGLVFIKRLSPKKATFKCHCGNVFDTYISDVKLNKSKSCGCNKTKSYYRVDIKYMDVINETTGIRFIEFVESEKYHKRKCRALCHCGKEFINSLSPMTSGKIKSCGCVRGKAGYISYLEDEILANGIKFKKELPYKDNENRKALMECHCGKIFTSIVAKVKIGKIISCGCARNEASSKPEKEVASFIKKHYKYPIKLNDRKMLGNGKELDIYLPDKNIAIEFNGLYWHSDARGKDSSYHNNKSIILSELGLNLIHIFEHQWLFKKDIVKNLLLRNLNPTKFKKIKSEDCVLVEIDTIQALDFIETNTLAYNLFATKYLGVFNNKNLVGVLAFKDDTLVEFSQKLNVLILNLDNLFKDNVKAISIDRAFPNLQILEECSLSWVKTIEPTPIYFKQLIISYTPIEGYKRIWDCGKDIYIIKTKL